MTNYLRAFGDILAARNGWRCQYCGAALVPYGVTSSDSGFYVKRTLKPGYRMATVDHINPRSKGGGNELANLALACWECNHEKADKQL